MQQIDKQWFNGGASPQCNLRIIDADSNKYLPDDKDENGHCQHE